MRFSLSAEGLEVTTLSAATPELAAELWAGDLLVAGHDVPEQFVVTTESATTGEIQRLRVEKRYEVFSGFKDKADELETRMKHAAFERNFESAIGFHDELYELEKRQDIRLSGHRDAIEHVVRKEKIKEELDLKCVGFEAYRI